MSWHREAHRAALTATAQRKSAERDEVLVTGHLQADQPGTVPSTATRSAGLPPAERVVPSASSVMFRAVAGGAAGTVA